MQNDMNKDRYENEVEIDILSAMSSVVRKWKVVFAAMIVVAVVGGFLSYYFEKKKVENQYSDETIELIKSELTVAEVAKVENLYAGYDVYNKKVEDIQEELDENPRLQDKYLDLLSVQYLYKSDCSGMVTLFSNYSLNGDDHDKIVAIYGLTGDREKYENQMFSITGDEVQSEYKIDTDADNQGSLLGIGSITNEYQGTLTVNMYVESKEQGEQILEVINGALIRRLEEIKSKGVEIELNKTADYYKQNFRKDEVEVLRREKVSEKADTLNLQVEYYDDNVSGLEKTQKDLFVSLKGKAENEIVKEVEFSASNAVIFGALGAVVTIIIIILVSICSGKVYTNNNVKNRTRDYVIASFKNRKKRILISAIADKLADAIDGSSDIAEGKDALEVVAEKVYMTVKRNDAKNVFIVAQFVTKKEEEVLSKIKDRLKKQGIEVNYGNPYANVDNSRKFYSCDSIVLLATTGKTTSKFINDIKLDSNRTDGKFVGSVVLYS
ncbi:MAG: hypothetical protein K6D02_05910 [Lachnospiraceae bacterium]|nr:hypothetical protein [Lachnospiraceae bacterium]